MASPRLNGWMSCAGSGATGSAGVAVVVSVVSKSMTVGRMSVETPLASVSIG
jgi:hypothetical protein